MASGSASVRVGGFGAFGFSCERYHQPGEDGIDGRGREKLGSLCHRILPKMQTSTMGKLESHLSSLTTSPEQAEVLLGY